MKKAAIAVWLAIIAISTMSFVWVTAKLIEFHNLEIIMRQEHAFTPSVGIEINQYSSIQLASLLVMTGASGFLIYGLVKKGKTIQ